MLGGGGGGTCVIILCNCNFLRGVSWPGGKLPPPPPKKKNIYIFFLKSEGKEIDDRKRR